MAKGKTVTEKWIRVKSFYAGAEGIFIQDEIKFVTEDTLAKLKGKLKYDIVDGPIAFEFKKRAKSVSKKKSGKKKNAADSKGQTGQAGKDADDSKAASTAEPKA